MKRIDSLQQLREYGIEALKGESDAHSYRILCDVTKRGKAIVERTFDVQLTMHDNWNGGTKDDPSIGSFLLPLDLVPSLAVFALLSDRDVTEAWLLKDGSVLGFGVPDIEAKEFHQKHLAGQVRNVFRAHGGSEPSSLHPAHGVICAFGFSGGACQRFIHPKGEFSGPERSFRPSEGSDRERRVARSRRNRGEPSGLVVQRGLRTEDHGQQNRRPHHVRKHVQGGGVMGTVPVRSALNQK